MSLYLPDRIDSPSVGQPNQLAFRLLKVKNAHQAIDMAVEGAPLRAAWRAAFAAVVAGKELDGYASAPPDRTNAIRPDIRPVAGGARG